MKTEDKNKLNYSVDEAMSLALAKEGKKSGKSGQEVYDEIKEDIREAKSSGVGASRAAEKVSALLMKIAIMDINGLIIKEGESSFYEQFISKIDTDKNGGGKEFIAVLPRVAKAYDANKFIADSVDEALIEFDTQTFYDANNQVLASSKQLKFDVVLNVNLMFQYFLNGKITEFYSEVVAAFIQKSRVLTLADITYQNIKQAIAGNKGKVVDDTTNTNSFDALTLGLFPEIRKMMLNTKAYNFDKTCSVMNSSRKEDLILIASTKTINTWETYLKTDSFVPNAIDIANLVATQHIANQELDFSGANGVIVDKNNEYIDDNTVVVIDRKYFLSILEFLVQSGEVSYPNNLTIQNILHYWINVKNIKWGKILIYKNTNLNTPI